MLWLAPWILASQTPDVTGLRAGETAVVVDAAPWFEPGVQDHYLRPRVLDARTGAPLANVAVEAWTEAGVEPFRAELRLDASVTRADGCARVLFVQGTGRADKVRLSKAGYASTVVSVSDVFHDEIRLDPAQPFSGRVLDLAGVPVAGALVRTRETCAHAVPAAQTRTDALGRFDLADFPPLTSAVPELEVVELHHESLYQLDVIELLTERAAYGSLDLYVARRRPVAIEVIDARGEPMSGRHVITKEAPVAEAWTGADGRCMLLPSSYASSSTYFLEDSPGAEASLVAYLVDGIVSRVSTFAPGEQALKGRAIVRIDGLNEGERGPPIVVAPELAPFRDAVNGTPFELPLGPARVYVGGDFSGWRKEARDVVVRETAAEIRFAPRREPRLTVTSKSWKQLSRLVAQAGDHSITGPDSAIVDDETFTFSVPADVPITVFAAFTDGELRRASLPPLTGDARIDLDLAPNLVRPARNAAPSLITMNVMIADARGQPIAGAIATLDCAVGELESTSGDDGRLAWSIPVSSVYRASFAAPGYTSVRCAGIALATSVTAPLAIVLTRRAQLELRGEIAQIDVGGTEPESVPNGFDLDVAAGPLTLCLERQGRPALALDLVLAPGETRRIDVH